MHLFRRYQETQTGREPVRKPMREAVRRFFQKHGSNILLGGLFIGVLGTCGAMITLRETKEASMPLRRGAETSIGGEFDEGGMTVPRDTAYFSVVDVNDRSVKIRAREGKYVAEKSIPLNGSARIGRTIITADARAEEVRICAGLFCSL